MIIKKNVYLLNSKFFFRNLQLHNETHLSFTVVVSIVKLKKSGMLQWLHDAYFSLNFKSII